MRLRYKKRELLKTKNNILGWRVGWLANNKVRAIDLPVGASRATFIYEAANDGRANKHAYIEPWNETSAFRSRSLLK